MKAFSPFNILDARKPVSHLAFFVLSLILTFLVKLSGKYPELPPFSFGLFLMLFLQLESFIYLGTKLFADLNFNRSPGEITRIVVIRFTFFLALCLVISLILFILLQYAIQFVNGVKFSDVVYNFVHTGFRQWFKSTTEGLAFGGIIFIVLLWQSSLQREQKLREQNLIFQNETLKNQVNPHFLFNSLNTLSSLINSQPEIADEFIGRLSSIYRYILENSSKDKVPLENELNFINDYFFLHKIRDDNKIRIEINVQNPDNYMILPVSLQILVENAIKHNIATRESPLKISIYLDGDYITVKNNLQKMSLKLKSTGIGLKNLAERIKLTTGKLLKIEENESDYIVKIPLIQ